jgi:exodeoxyribonuclease V alpha subunit
MSELLRDLQARGVLAPLDRHFAQGIAKIAGERDPRVLLAAALASRAVQHGHVCVDLARLRDAPLLDADEQPVLDLELPDPEEWCAALRRSALVGDGTAATPLVLDGAGRLYLWRYARYQSELAAHLRARAAVTLPVDAPALRAGLARLFPAAGRQRRAAAVAVQRALTVISGGPGTGKTTTVVRILALLQDQARAQAHGFARVLLLAPTGKAAQRLGEAVSAQLDALPCDPDVRAAIPRTAATLHRALGWQPRTPTRFRHDAARPLPAEIVVVDESSMIGLALMAKLVAAVAPRARLLLLGDRDQLASVEAGAIFGDLCGDAEDDAFSAERARATLAATGEELPVAGDHPAGLQDGVVHLVQSYRYAEGSGIDTLARAVNAGEPDRAVRALLGSDDVRWLTGVDEAALCDALAAELDAAFAGLEGELPEKMLARIARFRILCAHRRGPLGAEHVNALVEAWLRKRGTLHGNEEWYEGRPLLIARNDHQLELWNGDVGVIARDGSGQPKAFFAGEKSLRAFLPARLPPHETVFATTVHKSQGSEFDAVALVLPPAPSPVLTRELLYTGVTRAKKQVIVCGAESVLRAGIERRIERASGLRDELAGEA